MSNALISQTLSTLPAPARLLARVSPGFRDWLLSTVTARVDDAPGWAGHGGTPFDRPWDALYQQFLDALEAWRKNPLARRIVALTTAYVVSDGITLTSPYPPLERFMRRFWDHPKNRMDLRLAAMCDELTRTGELFPVLSRNPVDGMSYVRFVPAAEIDQVRWVPGDYETETAYHQYTTDLEGTWWRSPQHPDAGAGSQVMLHYAVNRPIGCVRGESDLAPILPWLRYYSQWLEDRVRLNWAARVFLWFVKVPTAKIPEKLAQYRVPPEPGSIIVHDDGESWDLKTPSLAARDASADGRQFRYMIAAGAGVPLHMLSEAEGTNLATAQAQGEPTYRAYSARQRFFVYVLADIALQAYEFWRQSLAPSHRPKACTHADVVARTADINPSDNQALAAASREIVGMLATLREQLAAAGVPAGAELNRRTVEMAFRFAGEFLSEDEIEALLASPALEEASHGA